ncbi:hypothetical protein J31TS4_28900 [Paenibacillus sp. J31TS4]|uniref:PQQ-dependent sugar dehydrogenase n=1 Tax=Paenibacillus sp. J31TS4 TaxID=2807195 RepID=UPI001B0D0C0C|nr:PQQ-dependent sugar dehydrogenase [Paenibacillus sp. J31TS4]GIP39610.1 hypothetical protein J31TS4_28900 [Paenibacillus sp. J31TS4]
MSNQVEPNREDARNSLCPNRLRRLSASGKVTKPQTVQWMGVPQAEGARRRGGLPLSAVWLAPALGLALLAGCSEEAASPPSSSPPAQERGKTAAPSAAPSANTAPHAGNPSAFPYTVEVAAEGLNVPWELVFAPDGRAFLTERPGQIRVMKNGVLEAEPVFKFTDPFLSRGEGGLLGLALDPRFADNRYMYVYHSYGEDGQVQNRVLRLKETAGGIVLDRVLIKNIPGDTNHNGGRIRFGPDGMLYVTTGERYEPELAQDRASLGGKLLRLQPDGAIPADNPFPGSPVYSWGHRNPQGLAWQPGTGALFSSEHGQSAHDELNRIEPGANYGWPLIEGDKTGEKGGTPLRPPLLHSGKETWAPSGMTFVTRGPWAGRLVIAQLRGQQLMSVRLEGPQSDRVAAAELWLQGVYGRLRSVTEGPDGSLYILTNNRDGRGTPASGDDKLLRLSLRP